jgi:Replication factor A protein 3
VCVQTPFARVSCKKALSMVNNIATPRVNASSIGNYINTGTVVRLVGESQGGDSIHAVDGPIKIHRTQGNSFQAGRIFEVVGTVNQDGSLNENNSYDWGEAAKFGMYFPLSLFFNRSL